METLLIIAFAIALTGFATIEIMLIRRLTAQNS